jgi:hypothetical protein
MGMKRIIEGKAYDTETALHVAHAEVWDRVDTDFGRLPTYSTSAYDLYRTKGGAFFLTIVTGRKIREAKWERDFEDLHTLTYDQAHRFVNGQATPTGQGHVHNQRVEILEEGIFPTVEEAVEETPKERATSLR